MEEDPHIILKRDNYPTDLALNCYQLLLQERYVDVTLSAQGGSLKAHRLVLSSSSDYFMEVLSQQPPDSHVIIVLDQISFNNLKLLIEYIYNGKVTVSQEELPALIEAASGLKIKGLLNESYRTETNDELLSQGALESTISIQPSLAGSRVPLPARERAASSLQNNRVMERSGDNNGPSYTSDQYQQLDPFVILDQDSMENPTTAFPIGSFVSTSNFSDPKEKGPEEEDPFGETGSAEDGPLMDWENTNDLGDNAEAHQLLANVEIVHPLSNTNPPAVLLDQGVRVLPEEFKKLKAEYLRHKAAKEQDMDRPKRVTMEKLSDTGTEVASEYDESADSSIHDTVVNPSPDYSTDDDSITSSKAGRNNEGEEEEEEEGTDSDAEKEMEEASSSEESDSNASDEDFAPGNSSPAYPSRSKATNKPSPSTKIIQPNKMSEKGSSTQQQQHQKSLKCDKCPRIYKRRESLKRHMALECGKERKFQCTVCDHRFGQKVSLQKHLMNVHGIDQSQLVLYGAGPKERPVLPFPCPKRCGSSFKSKGIMNRHTKACGVDPAFHCHLCNYRSKWKCDLGTHILHVHGVDPSK